MTAVNMHTPIPFAAEAMACLQAVQAGLKFGYRQVVIEGDALNVIRKIQSEEEDRSVISPYIADIKSLSKMFNKCCFNKISRNRNGVAHAISRDV
ncbi:hypothetical protein J1N35_037270 [Gossypium stocksii]|uniref:RNase H type-1 domain-containing protein n=1 Tax=Gossypium stocksii TaxID=47602 RepID=A0A9D3ZKR3_9ROSI|nr:hypothetical protein J1N35_037270 [Gossypium stocksii]